jgi:outer membrane protein assembly factor BamB
LFGFGASATTKVAIFEDILIVGVDFSAQNPASGQAVIALNKTDKSEIWTFPVDSRVNGQIVVGTTGNLYFATYNYAAKTSKLYSLDKNGQERWILDLPGPTELYPVLGENAVFMGIAGASGGKLVKIADN